MKSLFLSVIATLVAIMNPGEAAFASSANGIVAVNSLEELMPLLKQDNVEVKMAPGVYRVTASDIKSNKYPATSEVEEGIKKRVLILVEGNNSTYDFTGVTVEIETAIFTNLDPKYREFINLQTLGNHNVIKNLKLVDIGKETDFPNMGCTNIVLDGSFNRIEGVELYSIGSKPYRYGEVFGQGAGPAMPLKKHCGCLVRGYYNHVKSCKIVHHAYGHCLFMQAADHPIIEDCHIESEMTTTDNILLEKGSGSDADKLNFITTWGYKIPTGYTIACSEAGVRAYNAGRTMIDGQRFRRGTSNATVKGCTIKHARVGVVISHSVGENLIENCTAIGTERGFAVGSGGRIINCRTDVEFGPAMVVAYDSHENITADITIIPYPANEDRFVGNGSKQIALIKGSGHNITFKRDPSLADEGMNREFKIFVGGDDKTIGALAKDENYRAANITINNETLYPILLDDNSSNITGSTKGEVIDQGTSNNIKIER